MATVAVYTRCWQPEVGAAAPSPAASRTRGPVAAARKRSPDPPTCRMTPSGMGWLGTSSRRGRSIRFEWPRRWWGLIRTQAKHDHMQRQRRRTRQCSLGRTSAAMAAGG